MILNRRYDTLTTNERALAEIIGCTLILLIYAAGIIGTIAALAYAVRWVIRTA